MLPHGRAPLGRRLPVQRYADGYSQGDATGFRAVESAQDRISCPVCQYEATRGLKSVGPLRASAKWLQLETWPA